jgi:hypothetical protein
MKFVALAFLVAISASACKGDCIPVACSDPAELTATTWRVSGSVVDANTGQGLPHRVVLFDRFERTPSFCRFCEYGACPFCKIRSTTFRLITDEKGRFYFSSQIPGMYDVRTDAPRSEYCDKSIALGILKSQRLNVKLALKREPCPMIL